MKLFLLIYKPPVKSDQKILFDDIHWSIVKYIEDFRNFSKNTSSCRSEVLLVGDFNYPGVKRDELVRQKTDESCFLQFRGSLELFQLKKSPSHISGNTLNTLSATSDDTTYMTSLYLYD